MATVQAIQGIREAFTFDDVLLKPGLSDVLPGEVDIRSHVTRAIPLNIPIIASAMDTVPAARTRAPRRGWRSPWRKRADSESSTAISTLKARPPRCGR